MDSNNYCSSFHKLFLTSSDSYVLEVLERQNLRPLPYEVIIIVFLTSAFSGTSSVFRLVCLRVCPGENSFMS